MKHDEFEEQVTRVRKAREIKEAIERLMGCRSGINGSCSVTISNFQSEGPKMKFSDNDFELPVMLIRDCFKHIKEVALKSIDEKCAELKKDFEAL